MCIAHEHVPLLEDELAALEGLHDGVGPVEHDEAQVLAPGQLRHDHRAHHRHQPIGLGAGGLGEQPREAAHLAAPILALDAEVVVVEHARLPQLVRAR